MSNKSMVFAGPCSKCEHEITFTLSARQAATKNSDGELRIRCKNCRTINPMEQTGTL